MGVPTASGSPAGFYHHCVTRTVRSEDLACSREAIQLPGAIQARGALLAVDLATGLVGQASDNLHSFLSFTGTQALGQPLAHVLGQAWAEQVMQTHQNNHQAVRYPIRLDPAPGSTGASVTLNAMVHEVPTHSVGRSTRAVLIVEIEPATRSSAHDVEQVQVRSRVWLEQISAADSLGRLNSISVKALRDLTGYQRVMIYRFDESWCGEVVAEDRDSALEPWLGLRYPESDIPVQDRQLYTVSTMRVLADVDDYTVPLLVDPTVLGERPLDLTNSVLRALSPSHVSYLRHMGVRSSMSLSVLRENQLWGLVLFHHYDHAYIPDLSDRSAAHFVASMMSARLAQVLAREQAARVQRARHTVEVVKNQLLERQESFSDLLIHHDHLHTVIDSDAVVVHVEGVTTVQGQPLSPPVQHALVQWGINQHGHISTTLDLAQQLPQVADQLGHVQAALALPLPNDQCVVWVRRQRQQQVRWGGDPGKTDVRFDQSGQMIATARTQFTPFTQQVLLDAQPWQEDELVVAHQLRTELLQVLWERSQPDIRTAQVLRQVLIPIALPQPPGWSVQAHAQPAPGGSLGGDFYDTIALADGSFLVILGDVAGHGLSTAGVMVQLRGALTALAMAHPDPVQLLTQLDRFLAWNSPDVFASALALRIFPDTSHVQLASAGHPAPMWARLMGSDSDQRWAAEQMNLTPGPLLGMDAGPAPLSTLAVPPNAHLLLFTDGLVECRCHNLDDAIRELSEQLRTQLSHPTESELTASPPVDLAKLAIAVRCPHAEDDASLLLLSRRSASSQ